MRVLWGTPRVVIYGIIAGTFASGSVSAQETVRAGGVTALTGSAIAVRTNAEDVLALNDPIFKNDILETSAGGKLRVTFADDTQLTLGPDAEVIIDEFVYAPDKKSGNAALRFAAGTARIVAGAIEDNGGAAAFSISTPVATIGIRGTDFFVELDGDHLQVALFSGYEVTVTNAAGTTVLRPGEPCAGHGEPSSR